MNIRLMKSLDLIFGALLARVFSALALSSVPASPASFLLIRPGGIGDAVHLVPAIRAIRMAFPLAAIDILAERRNAAVFAFAEEVRRVIRYDVPAEFLSLFRGGYDVVIDTEQWHYLSAVVARIINGRFRTGFGTNSRSRLFNRVAGYSHDDYEVDSFFRLLEPFKVTAGVQGTPPWLVVPSDAAAQGASLLTSLEGKRFMVIFTGASIQERHWGSDRFREVAQYIRNMGMGVVVVGGRQDRATGDRICADGVGINLAGKTTLAETAAIIDRSALLISGDSGILHIGVALGKPTVSLFGPGIAAKWAPRGEGHIVLNRNLPCSPCTKFGTTPPCPHGVRCMSEITASDVVAAVERLLSPESRYSPK